MRVGLGQTLPATPDGHAAERRVTRELFPLPHVVEESVQDPTLSRCCQRRIEGGQMKVKEFIDEQLVSKDDALQRIEAIGPKTVYTDPKLRVRKAYVEFLGRLRELGLVDFSKEDAVEHVGVFFVKKKQKQAQTHPGL